jgi:GNAT superfamily N-acetyltransferase
MFKLIQIGTLVLQQIVGVGACSFASLMAREDALRLDAFVLEPPDGTELRALLDMLAHEDSGGTSALVDSVDGYGSFKALEEGIVDAWVSPAARRLGIGRSMVRRVCEQYPTIKGVRSCLPEALPFWDAVSAHISRSAASSRPRPPARPISMDDRVLRELARLRQKDDGEARDEDQHPVLRNHHAADNG